MSVATEALREVKIGMQMYAQPFTKRVPKFNSPIWSDIKHEWNDIRQDRFTTIGISLLGLVGVVGVGIVGLAFTYSDDQAKSEIEGVEEEAQVRVIGFKSVESAVHGSDLPFFTNPDTATIGLEGGASCTVEFKHDTSGPMGIPMGAEVTNWRDCPLIQQN